MSHVTYYYEHLAVNPLSRFWQRPDSNVCILPIAYVGGMVGYALSLPGRIFAVVKDLFLALGVLALFPCKFAMHPSVEYGAWLRVRGAVFVGSVGELFSAMVGVFCPPLAYRMDEGIQSNSIIHEGSWFTSWSNSEPNRLASVLERVGESAFSFTDRSDHLACNPLSSVWKADVAKPLLILTYVGGMMGYALALPFRILAIVKEILKVVLCLAAFPIFACMRDTYTWQNLLGGAVVGLGGSFAELGSAVIGVLCPPIAYSIDEALHETIYHEGSWNAWSHREPSRIASRIEHFPGEAIRRFERRPLSLRTAPLSNMWTRLSPNDWPLPILAYVPGMVGYALALPIRVLLFATSLLLLIGVLLLAPIVCCSHSLRKKWTEIVGKRGFDVLTRLGEMVVGVVGVACPPVAYVLDEEIDEFRRGQPQVAAPDPRPVIISADDPQEIDGVRRGQPHGASPPQPAISADDPQEIDMIQAVALAQEYAIDLSSMTEAELTCAGALFIYAEKVRCEQIPEELQKVPQEVLQGLILAEVAMSLSLPCKLSNEECKKLKARLGATPVEAIAAFAREIQKEYNSRSSRQRQKYADLMNPVFRQAYYQN